MEARRVLVTGASGFIGRQALSPLLDSGFEVHAVSRVLPDHSPHGIQWHTADLRVPENAQALLEAVHPTHLLHCAWYAEHGKFWESPENFKWISATLKLVDLFARQGGRRFLGVGSCAEYDWNGDVYDEAATPLNPATLYGAAKASAFVAASAFAQKAGLSFAWGRIFHVFGPGEPPARIVPALIRAHLSGQPLDCSQGTQLRDFLPASAVGQAFARLCAGEVQGAVNIGSGNGLTLRDLSEKIAALAGRRAEIRFGAFNDTGPSRLIPSVHRLTREAGWHPPESLDPGLREVLDWWKTRL